MTKRFFLTTIAIPLLVVFFLQPCLIIAKGIRGATVNSCNPLQVFILSGQSNMVGPASMKHLRILLNDTETHDEYAHLWNETSNAWIENQNVYVKFDNKVGKLKPGYGGDMFSKGHSFGPELEFGWVLSDALSSYISMGGTCNTTILLLKIAEGGRDLAIDFRPPSSGNGTYIVHRRQAPHDYGWLYRKMIKEIHSALTPSTLSSIIPSYNETEGYKIKGFVWFQGWNDMISKSKVKEYEFNLVNFIRDIRIDLNVPNLPFIIGELGQPGYNLQQRSAARVTAIREIQANVTLRTEFQNSTKFVSTKQYLNSSGTKYEKQYHYYGRADTFSSIGRAFAYAMLEFLVGSEQS